MLMAPLAMEIWWVRYVSVHKDNRVMLPIWHGGMLSFIIHLSFYVSLPNLLLTSFHVTCMRTREYASDTYLTI
jgi:hypothetical protein